MKYLPIVCLTILAIFYYITGPGAIVGSNDGSQYALTRAFFEKKTPNLNEYVKYTGYVNVSQYKGVFYSDRIPGLAITSSPLYILAKTINFALKIPDDPRKYEIIQNQQPTLAYREYPVTNSIILFLLIFPAIIGVLNVFIVWKICFILNQNKTISYLIATAFAFGSLNWKYSTLFFSHVLSTFVLLVIFYLLLKIKVSTIKPSLPLISCVVFLTGFLALIEYFNVLYAVIILIFIILTYRETISKKLVSYASFVAVVSFMLPILIWLSYHFILFDNPLKTTYSYHYFYEWSRTLSGAFSGDFIKGLTGQLLSVYRNGILISSPVVVLFPYGILLLYKKKPDIALLTLVLFLIPLLVISKAFDWNGGGFDVRYILAALPYLFIGMAMIPINRGMINTVFIMLTTLSIFKNAQMVLSSAQSSYSSSLNFNHFPYIYFVISLIVVIRLLLPVRRIRDKKLYYFGAIFFITSVVILIHNISTDWRVQSWNILYEDNFNQKKYHKNITYLKNIVQDSDILYAEVQGNKGIMTIDINTTKNAKSIFMIPSMVIESKGSTIEITIESSTDSIKTVFEGYPKKELHIKPFIDLSKIKGSKLLVTFTFFVDKKFGKTPYSSRLERLVVAEIK